MMSSGPNEPLTFWLSRVESQIDLTPCNGCDSCGIRCADGVPMSRAEYEGVQDYIARSPDSAYIDKVTRQDKLLDLGDGITIEMCRYRDMERGRCAIYPARPLICRLLGHIEWLPCPIDKVKTTANTRDALTLMQSYAIIERRTFDEWESITFTNHHPSP